MDELRTTILATVADLATALLHDDRKDDEELGRGAIEAALEAGTVNLGEMLEVFTDELGALLDIDIKLDVVCGDQHRYWSTHCRHDPGDGSGHRACSATVIVSANPYGEGDAAIARRPACCKTCAAPCICPCHKEAT